MIYLHNAGLMLKTLAQHQSNIVIESYTTTALTQRWAGLADI